MSFFEAAFAIVIGEEGVLSMDPVDAGNWTGGRAGAGLLRGTKYGISAAAFPQLDIANVTLDQARAIYREKYWDALGLDVQPWQRALPAFDAAVNQGQNWAKGLPQDALELLVERAMRYIQSESFIRYGRGWFRRLFTITRKAEHTPP